jgi:hypothetical protein
LEQWHTALEQADAGGYFYGSLTLTLAAGRKPAQD